MFKTFLALMLIALQGLCALPGRLHLCFESDGSICCVEGGEHDCQCDHGCHLDTDCHACDHDSLVNESCDEAAEELNAEGTHQHVVISATNMVSAPPKVAGDEVQDDGLMFALLSLQVEFYYLSAAPLSQRLHHLEIDTTSFSLLARASTVLRC